MSDAARQVEMFPARSKHGGARVGAGRKPIAGSKAVPHRSRPRVTKHLPVHAVLRVVRTVGRLRQGKILGAIERAALAVESRTGFQLVHVSIQHNHLHFLVEADHTDQLSLGMQALAITAAKAINRIMERKGRVFAYRYSAKVIRNPRQARSTLAYVLGNWRRHREDEGSIRARDAVIDPYSSAIHFDGWARDVAALPAWYPRLSVVPPASWLLTEGWRLAGPPLDPWATPGPEWSPTARREQRAARSQRRALITPG